MPKLLQINVDATNGSNGGVARYIGDLVYDKGWESYLFYGRNSIASKTSKIFRIGNGIDIIMHGLESLLLGNHGLASRRVTKRLIRKIKEISPDIIHLHNIHGYFLNYKILFDYLNNSSIPVVWTFHDCWPFTGHCAHFVTKKCNKWQDHCMECPLIHSYPKSLVIDNSFKNFDIKKELFTSNSNITITTVSEWLGDLVKQSFFKDKPIEVITNGVDHNVFRYRDPSRIRNQYDIQNDIVLLGVASTWTKEKGLEDYIKLSKKLPDSFKIILIGLSESQLNHIPANIIGVKRTSNLDELVEFYSACDISLNLSYQETFGLTTIEAMSCGAPCIVYDTTASPELVTNETGVIVPAGDINKLYDAILQIMNCGGRSNFSINCINRVNKNYLSSCNYQKYVDLYYKLLKD